MEGLLAENRLRARIAELQAYRRAGLRTFGEVEEAELERPQKSKGAQVRLLYASVFELLRVWRQSR